MISAVHNAIVKFARVVYNKSRRKDGASAFRQNAYREIIKVASALEVANEFLSLPEAQGRLTQMKLQKLAFIADGWNWVINENDLVDESAEAWNYGPVFKALYDHTKFFGSSPIPRGRLITPDDSEVMRFFGGKSKKSSPYRAELSPAQKSVIQHVWSRYGGLSAIELSQLTHRPGTPWFNAFSRGKNSVISLNDIKKHYQELATDAEKAA